MDRRPRSAVPRRRARWSLFVALFALLPTPFFLLVVGGLVPTLWTALFTVRGTLVALPKGTAEGFVTMGILWAHVLVLGGLLYLAAWLLTAVLYRLPSVRLAGALVALLIVALLGASLLRIYRLPGHNSAPPANLFEVYRALSR